MELDKRVTQFIAEHHVLTLATCADSQPYCCNCFYVYLPEEKCFAFTSDVKTRHGQEALNNTQVAANIVLETKTVGKIQGLQITGRAVQDDELPLTAQAKKAYLKAFPFAVLKKADLWLLHADFMKMTDNRLGFGKKLVWERNDK